MAHSVQKKFAQNLGGLPVRLLFAGVPPSSLSSVPFGLTRSTTLRFFTSSCNFSRFPGRPERQMTGAFAFAVLEEDASSFWAWNSCFVTSTCFVFPDVVISACCPCNVRSSAWLSTCSASAASQTCFCTFFLSAAVSSSFPCSSSAMVTCWPDIAILRCALYVFKALSSSSWSCFTFTGDFLFALDVDDEAAPPAACALAFFLFSISSGNIWKLVGHLYLIVMPGSFSSFGSKYITSPLNVWEGLKSRSTDSRSSFSGCSSSSILISSGSRQASTFIFVRSSPVTEKRSPMAEVSTTL
mmetsp:Transcript_3815/g.9322  ORF Transcript_3815/g.9322 Transcript_3815/m.9322 type:complete len:298 (-) Transcript_3815:188-1081(-)